MPLKFAQRIYLGLGSNLGDSRANLIQAVDLLEEHFQTPMIASSIYHSEPVEITEQPWFMNQVVTFEPNEGLTPTILLKVLKEIERLMGRAPGPRYGPRLIDLDLLFYKDWIFENGVLSIPHPKIEERLFVLAPLAELNPLLVDPRSKLNIQQMIERNAAKFRKCERVL